MADVWLHVVRDLSGFSGGSSGFRAWILRIANNRVIDARRSSDRRPDENPVAVVPESPTDVVDDVSPLEGSPELERLFRGLPESQRAVLYLRFVLDLPQGEIAEVLGFTVAAVKMQQRRGIDANSGRLERGAGNE